MRVAAGEEMTSSLTFDCQTSPFLSSNSLASTSVRGLGSAVDLPRLREQDHRRQQLLPEPSDTVGNCYPTLHMTSKPEPIFYVRPVDGGGAPVRFPNRGHRVAPQPAAMDNESSIAEKM